jgi:hypothetical protein
MLLQVPFEKSVIVMNTGVGGGNGFIVLPCAIGWYDVIGLFGVSFASLDTYDCQTH